MGHERWLLLNNISMDARSNSLTVDSHFSLENCADPNHFSNGDDGAVAAAVQAGRAFCSKTFPVGSLPQKRNAFN